MVESDYAPKDKNVRLNMPYNFSLYRKAQTFIPFELETNLCLKKSKKLAYGQRLAYIFL